MLRNAVFFALSLLLSSTIVHAQALKTWQSSKLPTDDIQNYLGSDADGHYTWQFRDFRKGKNFFKLNHYDKDFQFKSSKDVSMERDLLQGTIEVFKFGQSFAWLMLEREKGNILYSIVPVAPDGTTKPKVTLLKVPVRYFQEPEPKVHRFFSADGSKLLLVATQSNAHHGDVLKKNPLETHLAVLDADYKLLWNKDITWERPDKQTKTSAWAVTSDGDVLFTADYYEEEIVKKHLTDRDTMPSASHLFRMAKTDQKPVEVPIYTGPGRVNGCALYAAPGSKEASCACFYADQPRGGFQGIVNFGISVADAKMTSEKKTAFDKEVFDLFGKRNVDNSGNGLRATFELQHIVQKPDGGMLLYAEVSASILRIFFSNHQLTSARDCVRGDIALFDLDANGSLRRKAVFPRDLTFEGYYFNGTQGEKDNYSKYLSTLYHETKGSFFLGLDDEVHVRYYQADTSPQKKSKWSFKETINDMTLGTLHQDGKVTNQPLQEPAGPSAGPTPKLPLGNSLAYNILCRQLDNKFIQFEVRYLGQEVR